MPTEDKKPFELGPNQRKWIDALRSGKYKQGKSNLARRAGDTIEYCCLGVLCEIAGIKPKAGKYPNILQYDGADIYAPPEAIEFVALYGAAGDNVEPQFTTCADMNDVRKWNFGLIADWLEMHATAYFQFPK